MPSFLDTVKIAWEKPTLGHSPLMILHNKLQNIAKALRDWSKSLFGDAHMQMHMVNDHHATRCHARGKNLDGGGGGAQA